MDDQQLWFDQRNTARQTRSWFRYQDECVAYRCIPNLLDGDAQAIVTEWSTDYILIRADGTIELVSVKHRDPKLPGWTLSVLKQERVLIDLHRVWTHMEEVGKYAFESDAGLVGKDARALLHACSTRRSTDVERAVPILARHLDVREQEASRFLRALSLRSQPVPRQSEIGAVNRDLLRDVFKELGMDTRMVNLCYGDLVRRIESASSSFTLEGAERLSRLQGMIEHVSTQSYQSHPQDHTIELASLRLELFQKYSTASPVEKSSRRHLAPTPDPLFVGREQELQILDTSLSLGRRTSVPPAAIFGMSGIGKTSLAKEFAARNRDIVDMVFISGATRASLLEGLSSLGPADSSALEGGLDYSRCLDDPTVIVLIDGVTDSDVMRGLFQPTHRTRVIVTSTCRHLEDGFSEVRLGGWKADDSTSYIKGLLPNSTALQQGILADKLHSHPLAIAQAVNYCLAEGLDIEQYVARFEARPSSLLAVGSAAGHPESIYRTISMNVQAATRRDLNSGRLLTLLSLLGSEPVPEDLFDIDEKSIVAITRWSTNDYPAEEIWIRGGWRTLWRKKRTRGHLVPAHEQLWEMKRELADQATRDHAISVLHQYGLTARMDGGLITHPLIRLICRTTAIGLVDDDIWFSIVLGLFGRDLAEPRSGAAGDHLLPHIGEALSLAEEAGIDGPAIFAGHLRLASRIGELGDAELAASHASKAVAMSRERRLGPGYQIHALRTLAATKIVAGRYEESIEIAEEMRSIVPTGDSAREKYMALESLVQSLMHADRFDEAAVLVDELADTQSSIEDAGFVTRFTVDLLRAEIFLRRDALEEAYALAEELIQFARDAPESADRHFRRGLALDFKARVLRRKGHAEQSIQVSTEALAEYRLRRPETPDVHYTNQVVNTIHAELDLGETGLAEAHLEEVLGLLQSEATIPAPTRGRILAAQGRLLVAQGHLRSAYEPLSSAMTLLRPTGREVGRGIAEVLFHLAQAHAAYGRVDKALESATEARDVDQEIYGPGHREVLQDELLLAQLAIMSGHRSAAVAALDRTEAALAGRDDSNSIKMLQEVHIFRAALRSGRQRRPSGQ